MIYNLNLNYGKVLATGKGEERAAVFNDKGKLEHLPFKGSVDINDADNDYLTSFFGSSGYRLALKIVRHFYEGQLVRYISNNRCYEVTVNDKPIDYVSSHAPYYQLVGLIELGKIKPPNNVYSLH